MKSEKRKLNLFDVFGLGLGGALGSGIFVQMGTGISLTGRSICLAVVIGCVYMVLAYFYQVVISSMFVIPGGYYDMQAMLFTPTLTGVSAIFIYVSGMTLATSGLAIVDYAGMVFPAILEHKKLIAAIIMIAFFATSIRGSKFMARINNVMVVVLLVSIGLFVIVGLPKVQPNYFSNENSNFFMNGAGGFFSAIAVMGFACQGATGAPCSMMAVTKNARRTAPKAVLLIMVALAIIYGLMSIVAAGVLPMEQVIGHNLSVVADAIFPRALYVFFIIGGAVFAIATTLLSSIAQRREPCMQIAKDGWVPSIFKKTTKGGYPYVMYGFFLIVSLFSIIMGYSFQTLVSFVMIPGMLFNVYLNVAIIKLVKKYPEQWKASILHWMPMPIFYILCVIASICALAVAINLFMNMDITGMITCVIIIAICVVLATIRLKSGVVKRESLLHKQETIAKKAVEFTKEDL